VCFNTFFHAVTTIAAAQAITMTLTLDIMVMHLREPGKNFPQFILDLHLIVISFSVSIISLEFRMQHHFGCMISFFFSLLSCELHNMNRLGDYVLFTNYFIKKLKCVIASNVQGRNMFFSALRLVI